MVAALRSLKPTLIIGWGHKYQEVMKRFGQEEFVFDYKLDSNDIHDKMAALLGQENTVASQISEAFELERKASLVQFDHAAGILLEI